MAEIENTASIIRSKIWVIQEKITNPMSVAIPMTFWLIQKDPIFL